MAKRFKYSRYYLHRRIKKHVLSVKSAKKQIDVPADFDKSKLDMTTTKYLDHLIASYGYNIQYSIN